MHMCASASALKVPWTCTHSEYGHNGARGDGPSPDPCVPVYGREMASSLDNLTEIYSLIVSIDHVERAFLRDTIGSSDYNDIMARLLSQYNTLAQETEFHDLDTFAAQFKVEAAKGIHRIRIGIPATAEAVNMPKSEARGSGPRGNGSNAKAVAEVAGHFITFSDGVHLGFRGKDNLHPLLAELATSLNRVTKENFDGRGKIVEWLIKLNQLKPGETLSEDDAQICLVDVQKGYHSFLALLD